MKVLNLLLVLAFGLHVNAQNTYKRYENHSYANDSAKSIFISYALFQQNGLIIEEAVYDNEVDGDGSVTDTNYYRSKKFYRYNDGMLGSIIDCRAKHWREYKKTEINSYKDSLETILFYQAGKLIKEENKKGRKWYVYNNAKRIIRDTIIGSEFENDDLLTDTSFAVYSYFKDGYCIRRYTPDPYTYSIDSFLYQNNEQLTKHILISNICRYPLDIGDWKSARIITMARVVNYYFYSKEGKLEKILRYGRDKGKEELRYITRYIYKY